MNQVLDRFETVADDYETFTRKIPKYDRIVGTLIEVLDQLNREDTPDRIADLGVGAGNLAELVIERYGPTFFSGIDGAESMIQETRSRLTDSGGTDVELECTTFESWSPERSYDWIYSNLSIHHLFDFEKRSLYNRVNQSLGNDGAFLLSDLFRTPEKRSDLYEGVYRERLSSLGFNEDEINKRWERHLENDVPGELRATLRWLREIGFGTVECVWKDFNRAIILATADCRS